jgi:hypothetical protein
MMIISDSKTGYFQELGSIKNDFPANDYGAFRKEFDLRLASSILTRLSKLK